MSVSLYNCLLPVELAVYKISNQTKFLTLLMSGHVPDYGLLLAKKLHKVYGCKP